MPAADVHEHVVQTYKHPLPKGQKVAEWKAN